MLGLPPLGGLVYSPLPQPRQGHHEGQVCSGHGAAAAQLDVPAFQEATPATKPPCRVSCLDRLHSWAAFGFRSWVGWLQADPDPSSSSGSGDTSFLQVEEGDPREPVDKTLDGPVGSLSERQSSLPHLQPPAGFL